MEISKRDIFAAGIGALVSTALAAIIARKSDASCTASSSPSSSPSSSSGKCPFASQQKSAPEQAPAADDAASKCPHLANLAKQQPASSAAAASSSGNKCPHLAKEEERKKDWTSATPAEFKEHFKNAYNAVAEEATVKHLSVNANVIEVLMKQLGYTQEELDVVGAEYIPLMQGTGNPHPGADIKSKEFVLDLGSGFGLDAAIAAGKVGPQGRVLGLDIAAKEIALALEFVQKRRFTNIDFRLCDLSEKFLVPDGVVDCVISNGGLCLVQNKEHVFQEIFRVLKPGGRFSLSFTVRKRPLDASKRWPSCLVAFSSIETILPLATKAGFVRAEMDRSNAHTDVWDESQKQEGYNAAEDIEVHHHKSTEKTEYAYLHDGTVNVNDYFERVVIGGQKPAKQ